MNHYLIIQVCLPKHTKVQPGAWQGAYCGQEVDQRLLQTEEAPALERVGLTHQFIHKHAADIITIF